MSKFLRKILCITLSILLTLSLFSCMKGDRENETEHSTEEQLPIIEPPPNGYKFENLTSTSSSRASINLTIEVGEAKGYYIVLDPITIDCGEDTFFTTLEELTADYTYIRFYAHRYSTVELLVPPGEYAIYWAEGKDWYGEENLFGKDTIYYKGSTTETFTNSSYRLEFKDHGNVGINVIGKDEFPQ